jgi:hypothetical protein
VRHGTEGRGLVPQSVVLVGHCSRGQDWRHCSYWLHYSLTKFTLSVEGPRSLVEPPPLHSIMMVELRKVGKPETELMHMTTQSLYTLLAENLPPPRLMEKYLGEPVVSLVFPRLAT